MLLLPAPPNPQQKGKHDKKLTIVNRQTSLHHCKPKSVLLFCFVFYFYLRFCFKLNEDYSVIFVLVASGRLINLFNEIKIRQKHE